MSQRSSFVLSVGLVAALSTFGASSCSSSTGGPGAGGGADAGGGSGGSKAGGGAGGTGGVSSDAGTGGDAALPAPTFNVGKGCTKDGDCAVGLHCLTASSNDLGPGGPGGGVCTVDCAAKGQSACNAVDTASLCVSFDAASTKAFCLEGCIPGPAIAGIDKCHLRPDMACTPTQSGDAAYCAPTCRGDFDCGSRKCDPDTGLCADKISGTLDIGAACDSTAATNDCKGGCIPLGTSTAAGPESSVCTTRCTIGAPNGCGEAPGKKGTPNAACLLALDPIENAGDIGYCQQICDCDADCSNPNFVCEALPANVSLGRAGYCVPRATAQSHLTCGADGGVDGGVDGGKGGPQGTGGSGSKADGGVDGGVDGGR